MLTTPRAGIDDVTPRDDLRRKKAQLIADGYGKCTDYIAAYKKVHSARGVPISVRVCACTRLALLLHPYCNIVLHVHLDLPRQYVVTYETVARSLPVLVNPAVVRWLLGCCGLAMTAPVALSCGSSCMTTPLALDAAMPANPCAGIHRRSREHTHHDALAVHLRTTAG
jgi:hypothetical protein